MPVPPSDSGSGKTLASFLSYDIFIFSQKESKLRTFTLSKLVCFNPLIQIFFCLVQPVQKAVEFWDFDFEFADEPSDTSLKNNYKVSVA